MKANYCFNWCTGAGKTTILESYRVVNSSKGSIKFEDKQLIREPAHNIVTYGMAHVPKGEEYLQIKQCMKT